MIHNTARPRGRPRSFDETVALEKATQVFWSKGYDGVTIDDLVAGMGVGRPSLYAVFGDKRAIFLRVLKAYAERKGAAAAKALLSPQGLRDSIAGFLRYAVESATEKGSARGCLMVCVAPLVNDAEVQRFLQSAVAGGAALVEGRFRDGITAGRNPVRLSCGRARDPSHGFCSWPDHACADWRAAQDASQGCRGSGRLGAPAAPEGHQQAEAITFSRRRLSRVLGLGNGRLREVQSASGPIL